MDTLDDTKPTQLQEEAMILVVFMGGVRRQKNKDLEWEDFIFGDKKKEIFVRLKKTKGNPAGRCFAITDFESFSVLSKYKESVLKKSKIEKLEGPFYLIWNKPAQCWNLRGRGRDWFQKIPKDIADYLKKDKKNTLTIHSERLWQQNFMLPVLRMD